MSAERYKPPRRHREFDSVRGTRVRYDHRRASARSEVPEVEVRGAEGASGRGGVAECLFRAEERQQFDAIVGRLRRQLALSEASDETVVTSIAAALTRYRRAVEEGHADAAIMLSLIVRSHLKDLRATRALRGAEASMRKRSLARWATWLLATTTEAPP